MKLHEWHAARLQSNALKPMTILALFAALLTVNTSLVEVPAVLVVKDSLAAVFTTADNAHVAPTCSSAQPRHCYIKLWFLTLGALKEPLGTWACNGSSYPHGKQRGALGFGCTAVSAA